MNVSSRYAEAICIRSIQFQGMTPRELEIYLSGQEDGANIKADEIQPLIAKLEMMATDQITRAFPIHHQS